MDFLGQNTHFLPWNLSTLCLTNLLRTLPNLQTTESVTIIHNNNLDMTHVLVVDTPNYLEKTYPNLGLPHMQASNCPCQP